MGHSDQGDQPVPSPPASDHAEHGARQPSDCVVKARNDSNDTPQDDERRRKIDHLKQAVADGTYHVSAEEVARKIIEHMLEPKELLEPKD
jgi:anti-sigma28 factor (negative regulator of flagellin synthesis)